LEETANSEIRIQKKVFALASIHIRKALERSGISILAVSDFAVLTVQREWPKTLFNEIESLCPFVIDVDHASKPPKRAIFCEKKS